MVDNNKKYSIIVGLCGALAILLIVTMITCNKKQVAISDTKSYFQHKISDTVHTWIDMFHVEHATVQTIKINSEAEKATLIAQNQDISRRLGIRESQIRDMLGVGITKSGHGSVRIDTIYKGKSVEDSIRDFELAFHYRDSVNKSMTLNGTINNGVLNFDYNFYDSFTFVRHVKRDRFFSLPIGRIHTYMDGSGYNDKSVHITGLTDIEITDNKTTWVIVGAAGVSILNGRPVAMLGFGKVLYSFRKKNK